MPRTPYTKFKHRALLEENQVFLPDTAFIEERDPADLDARLYKTLPYLPKVSAELFSANDVFMLGKGTKNERTTIGITLCEKEPVSIFLSTPDEGYDVVNDPIVRFMPKDRTTRTKMTHAQHKSMLPFLYWHEKIEATVSMMIDPDDQLDFETYDLSPKLHLIMEAMADCYAAFVVIDNRDYYQQKGLDPIVPLASVAGKNLVKELDKYYTPIVDLLFKNPNDAKGAQALFEKYLKAARTYVSKSLDARLKESVE